MRNIYIYDDIPNGKPAFDGDWELKVIGFCLWQIIVVSLLTITKVYDKNGIAKR